MKKTALLILLAFVTIVQSQVGIKIESQLPEGQLVETSITIRNQFSFDNIIAYQTKCEYKIVDFYEYLSQYSAATDEELQLQIEQNITQLLENPEIFSIQLEDKTYTLSEVLQHVKAKNMKFSVKNITTQSLQNQFWELQYELNIVSAEKTTTENIIQNVFLKPTVKHYAMEEKIVWELSLGNSTKNIQN